MAYITNVAPKVVSSGEVNSGPRWFEMTVSQISYNPETNTSKERVSIIARGGDGTARAQCYAYVEYKNSSGTTTKSTVCSEEWEQSPHFVARTDKVMGYKDITVLHNADGTASVKLWCDGIVFINPMYGSGGVLTMAKKTCPLVKGNRGIVYIDSGSSFSQYQVYIDSGSKFELYAPYVDDGTKFVLCS